MTDYNKKCSYQFPNVKNGNIVGKLIYIRPIYIDIFDIYLLFLNLLSILNYQKQYSRHRNI